MARKRRLPKSLSPGELAAMVGAARRPRDRLILTVGYQTGLRVAEICNLQTTDIDWNAGTLFIRQGKGDRDRVVPVPAALLDRLRKFLGGRPEGYVFASPRGGKLTTRAVQKMVKRMAIAGRIAGADEPRRITPHKLRHTFATRVLRSGADIIEVRDLLGHSSVATTQIYLSAAPDRLKPAVERAAI